MFSKNHTSESWMFTIPGYATWNILKNHKQIFSAVVSLVPRPLYEQNKFSVDLHVDSAMCLLNAFVFSFKAQLNTLFCYVGSYSWLSSACFLVKTAFFKLHAMKFNYFGSDLLLRNAKIWIYRSQPPLLPLNCVSLKSGTFSFSFW